MRLFIDYREETIEQSFIKDNIFSRLSMNTEDNKRQRKEMFNIIFGLIMLAGGLSGEMVLIGTQSSDALAVLGGVILAIGIFQVLKKRD